MSAENPAPLPPDEEPLPWGKIALVSLAAAAVFGAGILWSTYLLRSQSQVCTRSGLPNTCST